MNSTEELLKYVVEEYKGIEKYVDCIKLCFYSRCIQQITRHVIAMLESQVVLF